MGGRGVFRTLYRAPQGWKLGVPSTFTIVFPRTGIFCNGLQRVFPQPVKPALYFEAFAAPFGYAQSRVSVVPQKRKKLQAQQNQAKSRNARFIPRGPAKTVGD